MKLFLVSSVNFQNESIRSDLYNHLLSIFSEVTFVGDGCTSQNYSYIDWKLSARRNLIYTFFALIRLYYIFKNTRPTHVISYSPKANLFCNILSKYFKYKHVAVVTGLGEIVFGRSIAKNIINSILLSLSYPKNSTWVTMNEGDQLCLGKNRNIFKKIYDLPGEGYTLKFKQNDYLNRSRKIDVIFLGRLIESKGIFLFLNSLLYLKENNHTINAAIIGKVDMDKKSTNKFHSIINQLDIKYYGYVEEEKKNKLLLDSKILVFPTTYGEGLPFVILEAQDAGCNVVTTNQPGCVRALSRENKNFISDINVISISNNILSALANFNNKNLESIILNRNWIANNFSLELVKDKYDFILMDSGFYRT
jgi:glycosyltransferase involved in cell wall biosynthesis